jgi:hypothetical protein
MIIFIKSSITRIFKQLLLQQSTYLSYLYVDIYIYNNTDVQLIFTTGIYQLSLSTVYFSLTETKLKLHSNMCYWILAYTLKMYAGAINFEVECSETSPEAKNQVEGWFFLNVVIR